MAWELLNVDPAPFHTSKHGLQSFLWVFLFLIHFYVGQGCQDAICQDTIHKHWREWIGTLGDPKEMGNKKEALMKNKDEKYTAFVDETFSKYFEP